MSQKIKRKSSAVDNPNQENPPDAPAGHLRVAPTLAQKVQDHFVPSGVVPIHFFVLKHWAPAASQLVAVLPIDLLSLQ